MRIIFGIIDYFDINGVTYLYDYTIIDGLIGVRKKICGLDIP